MVDLSHLQIEIWSLARLLAYARNSRTHSDAQIAQMLKQGTWYVPTLSVYYSDWDPADTADGQRDRKRFLQILKKIAAEIE